MAALLLAHLLTPGATMWSDGHMLIANSTPDGTISIPDDSVPDDSDPSVTAPDDLGHDLGEPLTTLTHTADPSPHLFDGRLYIYCSHDSPILDTNKTEISFGETTKYNMIDYRVLSMDASGKGPVTVHDTGVNLDNVPWASRKLWAPDAAFHKGTYYLYFPAIDDEGIFRIGVATSDAPAGPFVPQPTPIAGAYSIDPALFQDNDDDGTHYLVFGGIMGGQLQRWDSGSFNGSDACQIDRVKDDAPSLFPRIAKLSDDRLDITGDPTPLRILDGNGDPILTEDHARRFFEGVWLHKRYKVYYLSWSTGDTHTLVYATSDSVWGPYVYQGVLAEPVEGWTHHHGIVETPTGSDNWLLFYHDAHRSGLDYLRDVKVTPLPREDDGSIKPIRPKYGLPYSRDKYVKYDDKEMTSHVFTRQHHKGHQGSYHKRSGHQRSGHQGSGKRQRHSSRPTQ
jgi:hypothetical protein